MKKSILFISCEEANHICDKSQYGEASTWERFKLWIRLCYCGMSQKYSKRNSKLSEVIENGKVECLKNNERHKLQQQINEELAKQQQK